MGALQQFLISKFETEYDRLFLWAPVFFSFGIGIYFCLPVDPWFGWGIIALVLSILMLFLCRNNYLWRLLATAVLIVVCGYTISETKTTLLATPMIHKKVKGAKLEGTVLQAEHRPKDQRITLDSLVFSVWPNDQPKPHKVRISVRQKGVILQPGQRIQIEAMLLPTKSPIADGAYDFAYRSFFEGLGAAGFATKPPIILNDNPTGMLQNLRHNLTASLRREMPGLPGAIAAALITGDRSGIPDKVRQQFADSGIAHILAISGLHLSIIAGLVFLLVRRGLCLMPSIALNFQTKKWAAGVSILVTFIYLLLCGAATPALRAFCMTALVMIAIVLDRSALTLRNVALAALFILIFWPELLFSPSFQLSFAAVTALIAAYERYRTVGSETAVKRYKIPRVIYYIYGVMMTTLIASLATAPYAIYTFNRFAVHSIEANLVAIPLVSFWVMPAALFTVVTLPLGLAEYPVQALSMGIDFLTKVAEDVASWPLAVILIPQIPAWVMVVITLSFLWICIWRTKWRWAGFAPLIPVVVFLALLEIPDIFVSKRYGLIALRDGDTLWVNDTSRGWFITETWQQLAGLRIKKNLQDHPAFTCNDKFCKGNFKDRSISISRLWRPALSSCATVMIALSDVHKSCAPDVKVVGNDLKQDGTYGFLLNDGQLANVYKSRFQERTWSN